MSKKNPCVFCGALSFGPGCPFSPSKIHFHANDPKKCCYCGSVAHGPGCPFNPHGKVHVHGVDFNSMVKETIQTGITLGYLMTMLKSPITEMKAYELGIIDATGKRIKKPETLEEQTAYTPLEEYIISVKQTIGNKIGMVNNAIDVTMESNISTDQYSKICESTLNIKQKFQQLGEEFNKIVVSAYDSGLSGPTIEKLIVDSIIATEHK